MDLNLYYLSGRDDNGESLDLLVNTSSPQQAHRIWQEHWDEWILFSQRPVRGQPDQKLENKLLIYEVIFDPGTEGALAWGQDLVIVAHVPG